MRFLFGILFLPVLCCAEHVVLDFQDVTNYYGQFSAPLGHFYDGGPGGNLGVVGLADTFSDATVRGNSLAFPLHGSNVLYVKGGFEGSLSFEYNAHFGDPQYTTYIRLMNGDRFVTLFRIPATERFENSTATINFDGVATEIDFAVDANGGQAGNAGDVTYTYLEFSNLHPPEDPPSNAPRPAPPVSEPVPAPPVKQKPAPVQQIDAATVRSRNHGAGAVRSR